MTENNLASEVKEHVIFVFGKKVMSLMGDIGAGAIAGAAAAMVPTDAMKPWQKFCVGVGAYGIGRWVAQQSSTAIETEMDGIADFLCRMYEPLKNAQEAYQKKDEEDDKDVEEADEKVVEFQSKED